MSDYTFLVQGSAAEPYSIEVSLSPLIITCNCPAGQYMPLCKHRLQILVGKDPGIVGGDKSALAKIAEAGKEKNAIAIRETYEKSKAQTEKFYSSIKRIMKEYIERKIKRLSGELKTDKTVDKARTEINKIFEDIFIAADELAEAQYNLMSIFHKGHTNNDNKEDVT